MHEEICPLYDTDYEKSEFFSFQNEAVLVSASRSA